LLKLINEEGLWLTMLKRKCLKTQTITHVQKKLGDSQFWSGLMKGKDSFLSLGQFKPNNGIHIHFWEEKWLGASAVFPLTVLDSVQEKRFCGYDFQHHSTKRVISKRLGRQ
jgi:hypothetical protein